MATVSRFFSVPRTTFKTSQGLVDLPILYFDVTTVVAFFNAPLAGVEALLEGTHLRPAITRNGTATCAIAFYEYRDTSVGIYNEVGLAIPSIRAGEPAPRIGILDLFRDPRRRTIAFYIADLPVTTPLAHAAGREIWGYPKFVTQIPFSLSARHFDGAVLDPDGRREIVRLHGDLGRGVPVPPLSVATYTFLDGALIKTPIDVRGAFHIHGRGTLRLDVGDSDHEMARHLRLLGLAGATPAFAGATNRFQSKLFAGTRVALPSRAATPPPREC